MRKPTHSPTHQPTNPSGARGLTLAELAIVLSLGAILAAASSLLLLHGVWAFTFLPRAEITGQTALEILDAIIEGSFSTLDGRAVPGLRRAVGQRVPLEPAVWLAEDTRVGFLVSHDPGEASDNQYVVVRLEGGVIKRAVYSTRACPPPPVPEEIIPYQAAGAVRVAALASGPLFRYYRQDGARLAAPGCTSGSSIRRVEVAFTAQTGAGVIDQGDAALEVLSSAAIRFP